MPKKKVAKKAAVKKAAPAKKAAPVKKAAKSGVKPVTVKGSVGFRLRISPENHKQLKSVAEKNGVSQNTMINQLINNAK